MSTPNISWDAVALPPSSSDRSEDGGPPPNDARKVVPIYPRVETRVWFLGDIATVYTHYQHATYPCLGEACLHCGQGNPARLQGYAPVLVAGGFTPEGAESWHARVLHVPERNFNIGRGLRGRVYFIKIVKDGARKSYQFTFRYSKEPPIESFDPREVMQNVWYPKLYRKAFYFDEVRLAVKPSSTTAPTETTFADSLKAATPEALVELLDSYTKANIMPGQRRMIEDELHARGVKLSTDEPKPVDTSKPREPRPGVLGASKNGTVFFAPEDRPGTLPMTPAKRKGGAA